MPSSSPGLPQRIKKKRALSSLMAASKSHTLIYPPHTVVSECWRGKHQPTNSSTGSWAFCVDSFPLEAQFMSVYSTGWVTFRLWHLFLFRYHVWFLSNQLAPFPLTSPIREPAYYTSRTGQTEINLGQISAWGNFNEGKKKKKKVVQEQFRRVLFQAVLPCTSRMRSSSQSFKAGIIPGIIPTPSLDSNETEAQRLNDLVQSRTLRVKPLLEPLVSKSPSTTILLPLGCL